MGISPPRPRRTERTIDVGAAGIAAEDGGGRFGQFVRAISRNPAMLDYLNNTQNHKGHPNENYARELMELFTLGLAITPKTT